MIKTRRKVVGFVGILMLLVMGVMFCTVTNIIYAKADSSEDFMNNINSMVFTNEEAFEFTPLSETECSVKLVDKTLQTIRVPKTVIINNKDYIVKEISPNAFATTTGLRTVILPTTVKKIGSAAFQNCKSLELVYAPAVQEIGMSAFALCPKLNDIIFPATLEKVGASVFLRNTTKVHARFDNVPNGWVANWNSGNSVKLEEHDFNELDAAGHLWKHDFIYEERSQARSRTVVKQLAPIQPYSEQIDHGDIIISADEMNLATCTFMESNLNSITIETGDTPINIESMAFYGVTVQSGITINRNVTYMNPDGFESVMVFNMVTAEYITLPTPDVIIEGMFFFNNIKNINFTDQNGNVSTESAYTVRIPEGVKEIKAQAFYGVTSIEALYIPVSVLTIGVEAFAEWTDSQTIHIPYLTVSQADNQWGSEWKKQCNANIKCLGEFTLLEMAGEIIDPNKTYYYYFEFTVPQKNYFDIYTPTFSSNSTKSVLSLSLIKTDRQNSDGSWTRHYSLGMKIKTTSIGGADFRIKTEIMYNDQALETYWTPWNKVHIVFRTEEDFKNYNFDEDTKPQYNYYLYCDVNFNQYTSISGLGRGLKQNNYGNLYGNGHTVTWKMDFGTMPSGRVVATGLFSNNYGKIYNLKINVTVNVNSYETVSNQTGLVRCYGIAENNESVIENCEVIMNSYINCPNSYISGISYANNGTIKNCIVKGKLHSAPVRINVGGITMVNWSAGNISGCHNEAALIGYRLMGGIASQNHGNISDCSNKGILTLNFKYFDGGIASNGSLGGIIGTNSGKCSDCTNFGTIKFGQIEDSAYMLFVEPEIGQIIGYNEGGSFENYQCKGNVDSGPLQVYNGQNQLKYVSNGVVGRID